MRVPRWVSGKVAVPPDPSLGSTQVTEPRLTSPHTHLLGAFRPGAVTVTLPSPSTLGLKTVGMWSATGGRREAGARGEDDAGALPEGESV